MVKTQDTGTVFVFLLTIGITLSIIGFLTGSIAGGIFSLGLFFIVCAYLYKQSVKRNVVLYLSKKFILKSYTEPVKKILTVLIHIANVLSIIIASFCLTIILIMLIILFFAVVYELLGII